MKKYLSAMATVLGLLLFIFYILPPLLPVRASDLWLGREYNVFGQFLTREGKDFLPVSFPRMGGSGDFSSETYYLASNGQIGLGLREKKTFEGSYSRNAGEILYYLLQGYDIPMVYSNVDLTTTEYRRTDLLLSTFFSGKNWGLETGGFLINASNLSRMEIHNGNLTRANNTSLSFDFNADYARWTGYNHDNATGYGFYCKFNYRINDLLAVHFTGDDLGSVIVWTDGLDETHGKIDLDILKKDEEGYTYVSSPITGHTILDHGTLVLKPTSRLQAKAEWNLPHLRLTNWVQYHETWGAGVKASLLLQRLPELTLGVGYENQSLLYQLGMHWPYLQIELAANHLTRNEWTNFRLSVVTHLF